MGYRKVLRFCSIYGISRTLIKLAGRTRNAYLRLIFLRPAIARRRSISLIGCGQFGFSTISYYLLKGRGRVFCDCFDIDHEKAQSASRFFGYTAVPSVRELLDNPDCELVYIASNHASHTPYAIEALYRGLTVYIEKPIAVNWQQFRALLAARAASGGSVYSGYNRPFSRAIRTLASRISGTRLPLTIACTIFGHKIPADHWYRNPEEGTRICGNVGHWLDLAVHLMNQRGRIPDQFTVSISYSNSQERDDNLSLTLTTPESDLVTITLTSREEPFEGIIEQISLQAGPLSASIDDFRRMSIWEGPDKDSYRYYPKDVGHKMAIRQPWLKEKRDFTEVEISTTLMLSITDMVLAGHTTKVLMPFDTLASLKKL